MIVKKHSKMPARYIDAILAEELLKKGYGIVEVPTEDVAPIVHAHWEKVADHVFRCSLCNNHRRYASNYCPNCGAKMDGEESQDA